MDPAGAKTISGETARILRAASAAVLCNDRPRMEWGEAPPAKGTAKSGIRLVKRQDRRAQGTDMDHLVTFVCERFRHVKWSAGPEPDLARIADRGECNPPRYLATGGVVLNYFSSSPTASWPIRNVSLSVGEQKAAAQFWTFTG